LEPVLPIMWKKNRMEEEKKLVRKSLPQVWLIRYTDGHLESAGTDRKQAELLAEKNAKDHGGSAIVL